MHVVKSARPWKKYQEEYSEMQREAKSLLRTDNGVYNDDHATTAEEAVNKGMQGNLYRIKKEVCDTDRTSQSILVLDKSWKLLLPEKDQEERLTNHFQEILPAIQ